MSVLGTVSSDQQPGEPAAVATTGSSGSRRRLLIVLLGVLVLLGGVAGYLLTSGFFEEPQQVLVAAVDIPRGSAVSAGDLAGVRVDIGGIPHIAWSPMAAGALSGLVALAPIPAGAVVHGGLFFDPAGAPSGEDLEVIVPLDTSLVPTPPQRGDLVLLVDPGAPPTERDPGRPRQVFQWLELRDFDGSSMRMFVPPAEWAQWRDVHAALGSAPQVLPVPPGGDPEAMARSLNEVWAAEWEAEAQFIEASLPEPEPVHGAGPGELEVIVPLDTRLVPSGVRTGDLVLLVDPGAEPTASDSGRPRRVIRTLELREFQGTSVRLFVPPREWIEWRLLATEIGADPLVLPVPDGTDAEQMAAQLDAVWESRWRQDVAALPTAPAGWFQVSLPLDEAGAAAPLRDGDLVLIVDPGRPAQINDLGLGDPGRPPSVIESRVLEGWDGGVATFWAPPDRWAYYTYLPQRLGATPIVLPVNQPADRKLDASEVRALVEAVDAAYLQWAP